MRTVRKSTIQRNRKAIAVFLRLLRSGKDFTTEYMYSEAGRSVFMEKTSVSMVIRQHYKDHILTQDMVSFYKSIKMEPYDEKMKLIEKRYGFCPRESRLVIRHLNRLICSNERKSRNE